MVHVPSIQESRFVPWNCLPTYWTAQSLIVMVPLNSQWPDVPTKTWHSSTIEVYLDPTFCPILWCLFGLNSRKPKATFSRLLFHWELLQPHPNENPVYGVDHDHVHQPLYQCTWPRHSRKHSITTKTLHSLDRLSVQNTQIPWKHSITTKTLHPLDRFWVQNTQIPWSRQTLNGPSFWCNDKPDWVQLAGLWSQAQTLPSSEIWDHGWYNLHTLHLNELSINSTPTKSQFSSTYSNLRNKPASHRSP